jgi:hypothetical protein
VLTYSKPLVMLYQKASQELLDRVLRDVWRLHGKPVARDLVRAVVDLLDDVTLTKLSAALRTGNVDTVLAVIPWDDLDMSDTFTHLRASYELAGRRAASKYGSTFTVTSPQVLRWVLGAGEVLPRYVELHKVPAMREILARAAARGYSPARTARLMLKGDLVALTPRDVSAVFNMLRRLQEQGLAIDMADARAIAYSRRLLRARALLIAEDQLKRAAVDGAIQAWTDLQAEGEISSQAVLKWNARRGNEPWPCDDCEPMDGMTTPLGTMFYGRLMPPLHPRCWCTVSLVDPARSRSR